MLFPKDQRITVYRKMVVTLDIRFGPHACRCFDCLRSAHVRGIRWRSNISDMCFSNHTSQMPSLILSDVSENKIFSPIPGHFKEVQVHTVTSHSVRRRLLLHEFGRTVQLNGFGKRLRVIDVFRTTSSNVPDRSSDECVQYALIPANRSQTPTFSGNVGVFEVFIGADSVYFCVSMYERRQSAMWFRFRCIPATRLLSGSQPPSFL